MSRRLTTSALLTALLCGALLTGCNLFPVLPFGGPDLKVDKDKDKDKDKTAASTAPVLPSKNAQRASQFVFYSDFDIPKNTSVFRDLDQFRDEVYKELQIPPSNRLVQVYLFEDRDRYEKFMQSKYPKLPARRAFFVAQPRRLGGEDLLVFTYWGDRIQQDLRHELTHAILHSGLMNVPIWLDEGLAEYFEMPTAWNGVNYQHLEQLRRGPNGPAKIDLERLEKLSEGDQAKQVDLMSQVEYRESWAWVHLMLRSTPAAKQVLIGYLHELRTTEHPPALRPRLTRVMGNLDASLERHLDELDLSRPRPSSARNK